MIKTKYPTTLEYDHRILDALNGNDTSDESIKKLLEDRKENFWRLKLAVIHRVNQKEILHQQYRYCQLLLTIMLKSEVLLNQKPHATE